MRICVVGWHGMPHVRRFARFFASRGHQVSVVTCGGSDATDRDENEVTLPRSYDLVELGEPRGGKLGYLLAVPSARRAVRAFRPDVVHAHTATSYGLLALASGVRPLAVTTHGSDVLLSTRSARLRPVVRRVLRTADLVSVPGEHMKDTVVELRGREEGVVVLQYGVEAERLALVGRSVRSERDGDGLRLVTARPLTKLYNTDVVIRAAALLDREWTLDVAGDGPERESLTQLAAGLGVAGRVRFHGQVDDAVAERLIAGADLYLSLASSDGVSIALLECLALGTLPVLSDIPANRAWVDDGVDGVLTPVEPAAVAAAIRQALSLDVGRARDSAFRRVQATADRETNLRRFEELLGALIAVSR